MPPPGRGVRSMSDGGFMLPILLCVGVMASSVSGLLPGPSAPSTSDAAWSGLSPAGVWLSAAAAANATEGRPSERFDGEGPERGGTGNPKLARGDLRFGGEKGDEVDADARGVDGSDDDNAGNAPDTFFGVADVEASDGGSSAVGDGSGEGWLSERAARRAEPVGVRQPSLASVACESRDAPCVNQPARLGRTGDELPSSNHAHPRRNGTAVAQVEGAISQNPIAAIAPAWLGEDSERLTISKLLPRGREAAKALEVVARLVAVAEGRPARAEAAGAPFAATAVARLAVAGPDRLAAEARTERRRVAGRAATRLRPAPGERSR